LISFVLDNSIAMRWCFENTSNRYAEAVLQQLASGGEAAAPVLWLYAVGSVLAKAQKNGAIAPRKAAEFLQDLKSLKIRIDRDGVDRILTDVHRLAVTHRLTGYDAAYLELATRRGLPLATLDQDLIRACKESGAAVYEPEPLTAS
jgi:predicted nucleic acid-binding protein